MTEQEMMKEALEWQEYIRELITVTDYELYHKRSKVFDWLIKQTEKREYWMKQHRKRANELEDAYFKIQLIEKQLHQAQAKAERYEKALEFYADRDNYKLEHFDPNLDDYMSTVDYDEGAEARKALESEK